MPHFPGLIRALGCFLVILVTAGSASSQDRARKRARTPAELQEKIDVAIDKGIEYLRRQQHIDGAWTGGHFGRYRVGPTALCGYALVESGVGRSDPAVQLALRFLEGRDPVMTYSAGCLMLFLAELNDPKQKKRMQRTLDLLVDWENKHTRGTWAYPEGVVDLSNSQFAALGFWAAHRAKLKVPIKTLQRMVDSTMKLHQEEPHRESFSIKGERYDEEVKQKIAGFTYLARDQKHGPRGSMTAAGLGMLRIARIVGGKRLGGGRRAAMKRSEEQGLGWLTKYWTVKENPGHNGQHLYYLWALERLGAFLETDYVGGHPWYVEGARHLVGAQAANGGWVNPAETSFALLFLTRATRGGTTGSKRDREAAAWRQEKGAVKFRATGKLDLRAWVTDVEEPPQDLDAVVWYVNGKEVKRHEVDGDRPAALKTYALEWTAPREGDYRLRVALEGGDEDGQPLTRRSEELTVKCLWDAIAWARRVAAAKIPKNLLAGRVVTATSSTAKNGQGPDRVADGYAGTYWLATSKDDAPWIEVRLAKRVRANTLLVSTPATCLETRHRYAEVRKISIKIDKQEPFTAELPALTPGMVEIPLPKKSKIKKIRIRIVEADESRSDQVGLAEVGLALR